MGESDHSQIGGSHSLSSILSSSTFSSSLQAITPKLTRTNFRFWQSQKLSTVRAHDLEKHLLGYIACPAPINQVQPAISATEPSLITKPNPEYALWKKKDKLLVS